MRAIAAGVALTLLAAGAPVAGAPAAAAAAAVPWWNDAVFYEVFVRSFQDSDGDGVGDLPGLVSRLDYLNDGDPATSSDLGVTGIWLMPITESPSDHGYDVTDYTRVDSEYGTLDDFRMLLAEAHRRGIRVIMDLVINHTSSEHPWFVESRARRDGPRRGFYVWRDDDPGWPGPWGAEAWHRDETGWYYGVFWDGMPDLNYRYAPVTEAMNDIVRFWLTDIGVDGFRLDAVKHLIEDGRVQENTPETHRWLRGYHRLTTSLRQDALSVGEIWSSTDQVVPYIGGEVDLAFEFQTAQAFLKSALRENSEAARAALGTVTAVYPPGQYALFLSNHDQDRVLRTVRGDRNRARTAASLLLTAPGVPFLYYGEEVGQSGGKPDPNIRSPMQWSAESGAGFTTGTPWRQPQADFREVNVAAEASDDASLLSHYRRLIHLRSNHAALRHGSWDDVPCSDPGVYSCLRSLPGETLLVLINLTGEEKRDYILTLAYGPLQGGGARRLLSDAPVEPPGVTDRGGFRDYTPVALAPHETAVIELR